MKTKLFSALVAVAIAASVGVASVYAVSASITPATQSHAHNVSSHWTGSWSGRTNFHAEFDYGDGSPVVIYDGASTSRSYSHIFSPCPGDSTTFYQTLQVWDNVGHGSSLLATSTSSATESAGTPC